jgi:hypothetical protein
VRYLAGLLQTAAPDSPLIIALPESLQWDEKNIEKSRQAVGSALKKRALRIFGGYRIERGPTDSHNKTATWSILKVSRECGDLRGLAGSLLYPAREKKIDKNFLGMKEWKKSRKSPQVPARVKR